MLHTHMSIISDGYEGLEGCLFSTLFLQLSVVMLPPPSRVLTMSLEVDTELQ